MKSPGEEESSDVPLQAEGLEVFDLKRELEQAQQIAHFYKSYSDFSQLGEERLIINILKRISKVRDIQKSYLDIG